MFFPSGLTFGLQFNGIMKTTASVNDQGVLKINSKIENLNHTLNQFVWPGSFIGVFASKHSPDWDEAGTLFEKKNNSHFCFFLFSVF